MVTPRWHSPPAPAHMAARFSAHSMAGGPGGGGGKCFLGAIQREPWQPALEVPGAGTRDGGDRGHVRRDIP